MIIVSIYLSSLLSIIMKLERIKLDELCGTIHGAQYTTKKNPSIKCLSFQ